MKKNNLKNYFKFGIFLFGISLLLWNCEKETNNDFILENHTIITIEEVQKVFDSSFNKNEFRNLPKNPLWENSKAFYGKNNIFYLEIPFYQINKEDRDLSTSISFDKLLAYKDANDKISLKIVHFFALKNNNGILDFDLITHSELLNYNGFLTFYDLNKNVLDVKQYLNGVDTNKTITIKDENDSSFSREDETGYQYSETTCTRGCWYWEYSDGHQETIHCSPWSCTTTTYYTGGGGGNSGGNSSGTSYNSNNSSANDNNFTEVLEQESNYKNRMSTEELNIYENLARSVQLLYLQSAYNAEILTESLFPPTQDNPCSAHNGQGDAFRHAMWNALSTVRIGETLTKQLTTAHENSPRPAGYTVAQYNAEKQMDLYNNARGRELAYTSSLVLDAVKNAKESGNLRSLSNLNPNNCLPTSNSNLIPTN